MMSPRRQLIPGRKRIGAKRSALTVAALSGVFSLATPLATAGELVSTVADECCLPEMTADPCMPRPSTTIPSLTSPVDPTTPPAPTLSETMQSQPLDATAPSEIDVNQFFEPSQPAATTAGRAPTNSQASSLASTSGSRGGLDAPNMLGDFLGQTTFIIPGQGPNSSFAIANPTLANQRFKVSENVSPIPKDTVLLNIHSYTAALQNTDGPQTLYRYQLGAEKAFLEDLFSVEIRMSITDGFASTQSNTSGIDESSEFGNLQFAFKSLLYSDCRTKIGAGTTLAVPTADDVVIVDNGTIQNESVYLGPFIGFVRRVQEASFIQGFLQTDLTLGGDTVIDGLGGTAGVFQQQNFIYSSLSVGHWCYRNQSRGACINGIAGLLELHYSTTTNDADSITFTGSDGFSQSQFGTADTFGGANNLRSDFLNGIAGMVVRRGKTNLRFGIGTPFRSALDQNFDMEYQFQLNRVY